MADFDEDFAFTCHGGPLFWLIEELSRATFDKTNGVALI